MTKTAGMLSALVAGVALVRGGAAHAETTYTSTLHQGYCASTGQVMRTTTGGSYTLSTPYWSMATSGSPADHGTAEASFSAVTAANQIWAGTNIEYILRLTGPADTLVPVHITASGNVDGYGRTYHAAASFHLMSGEQCTLVDASAIVYLDGQSHTEGSSARLAVDQTAHIMSNTDLYVSLSASAGTYSDYLVMATGGHAFIDPQFTVDPAYASQYTFLGLPTAAVPEPGSAALLAFGGGFIALTRRRRASRVYEARLAAGCAASGHDRSLSVDARGS